MTKILGQHGKAGISQLEIKPSRFSFKNSGGLCGCFDKNPNNDLFIWNKVNGRDQIQLTDVNNMAKFWRYY
jgi:hypothetical protein